MVTRPLILLLTTSALLSACGENDRREFIYKPAYCLAGGLAQVSSEECLPEALKEKAAAVATAKLKDATAEVPSDDLRVYYTDDQRISMSYEIARTLFAPSSKLTKSSAAMSLEASNIIDPTNTACGVEKANKDTVNFVRDQVSDHAINRDTADFLAEHYTDLQLTELYRVAKAGGKLADVKDDAFIMPDPKRPGKSINVKPKNGSELGGILSFTTSRVTSRVVDERHAAILSNLKERTAFHCPPPPPEPTPEPQPEAADTITEGASQ